MTAHPDEVVICRGNITNMTTVVNTFQAPFQDSFPSDDEYTSSISHYNSEEDSDIDKDVDEENHNHDCLLDIYGDFPEGVELFKSSKPSKQKWKLGWPREGETAESTWVHVYVRLL